MEAINKFFGNLQGQSDKLNVAKLGQVVSFNSENWTAEIQPLPSEDYAVALNVPVLMLRSDNFYIYNPLQEGDLVLLVYVDNDIDNILQGADSLNTDRQHNESDCICVGNVGYLHDPIAVENVEDLVISNKEGTATININTDGDIEIKGKTLKMEIEDTVDIKAGKSIKQQAERIDLN